MDMLALLFLLPLAFVGFGLFDSDDDEDEVGGGTPAGDDVALNAGDGDYVGTEGNDTIAAGGGYDGTIDAGTGNDTITAEGTAAPGAQPFLWDGYAVGWQNGPHVGDASAGVPGVIAVRGGAGDDSITAGGYGLDIDGGEGADRIDAGGLLGGHVHVGAGDSLILPEATANGFHWSVGKNGALDLQGMTARQVVSAAAGASVTGGGGGDQLTTAGGGARLEGGEGDDILRGNYNAAAFNSSTHRFDFDDFVGLGDDSLDGGAGEDTLFGDRGDTLTGGEGSDVFSLWLVTGSVAHVTDYDPAEDEIRLHVDGLQVTADQIGAVERAGDTVVTLDGEDIAVLEGRTGLGVAIGGSGPGNTPLPWQDAHGNPLPMDRDGGLLHPEDYPVIVERYFPTP